MWGRAGEADGHADPPTTVAANLSLLLAGVLQRRVCLLCNIDVLFMSHLDRLTTGFGTETKLPGYGDGWWWCWCHTVSKQCHMPTIDFIPFSHSLSLGFSLSHSFMLSLILVMCQYTSIAQNRLRWYPKTQLLLVQHVRVRVCVWCGATTQKCWASTKMLFVV